MTMKVSIMAPQQLIWAVLVLFVALSFSASVVNPLHEATDELRHYRFVQYIIQRRALPVQGEVGCSAQGHHPPLFYAVAALATFWVDTGRDVCFEPEINPFWNYRQWEVSVDNKNLYLHGPDEAFPWYGTALAAHLTRLVNILFGAATVYVTWLLGCALWPKRPFLALGGAAFIAFNPMFIYLAGAVNNDVIAALAGTIIMLACVQLVQDENGLSRRWGIQLGLLFGIALLSKFNLLAIGGVMATAVTLVAWRKNQWRLWLEVALISGLFTLLVSGWWFGRNQMLYGEPTGVQRLTELWGMRDPSESWGIAIYELTPTWTSLWGRFGYGQIPLPAAVYTLLRWLVGVGFLGLFIPIVRRRDEDKRLERPLLLLAINMLLFFIVVFNYLLISPAGAMGRFYFPALSSLSLLCFYGWSCWGDFLFKNTRLNINKGVAIATYGVMIGLSVVAIFGYLAPAYAKPDPFSENTAVPNPTNAQFDALINLRGYEIKQTAVQPGQPLDIDLYWEVTGQPPGNYLMFVHLIDAETNTMVVQRDTHPGLGNAPARYWQTGERFVESVRVWLPETAYSPALANVSVGFYAPGSYRLGIVGEDGAGLGDALQLGQIQIEPWETPDLGQQFANPLDQNFNNEIRLIGYDYGSRFIQPGQPLELSLVWQALQDNPTDYLVRVRLLDEAGRVITAVEEQPNPSATSQWQAGEIIQDSHTITPPFDLPLGNYRIHVALIDSESKAPQNIVAEDGHWINNHLLLSLVQNR